ncbi:uncharacterized protein [Dysidea avara]|uniref:uncharacterized protein isoform X2 n=2 Tax=Dysidea avara TaxID=196820 RepID=UPI0033335C15
MASLAGRRVQVIKAHCTALKQCRRTLAEVDIRDLLPYLLEQEIIETDTECSNVDDLVVDMIAASDEKCFLRFLGVLENLPKYEQIAKTLRDKWKEAKKEYQESQQHNGHQMRQISHQPPPSGPNPITGLLTSCMGIHYSQYVSEDGAVRRMICRQLIAKDITEALKCCCNFLVELFQCEKVYTKPAECQVDKITLELTTLQQNISKEPTEKEVKEIVKKLLTHMKDVSRVVTNTVSILKFNLKKVCALQVIMEALIELVERLSEEHNDEAIEGLRVQYNKLLKKIEYTIALYDLNNPKVYSAIGALVGGVGVGLICLIVFNPATISVAIGCVAVGGVSGAAVGFGTGYYIGKKAKEAVETRKCTGKREGTALVERYKAKKNNNFE